MYRFNQYLQAVGSDRQVWSFGVELADGVAWCTLLNAIDPAACPPADERDCEANASNVISAVHQMGIKVRACKGGTGLGVKNGRKEEGWGGELGTGRGGYEHGGGGGCCGTC